MTLNIPFDEMRQRLEGFLIRQTGKNTILDRAEPLAGGASRDMWLIEITVEGVHQKLVLRRDPPTTMSEQALTRAQEVNKEMYEDLLKRRENARVSMSLDADGRSLGFQIQEPATVPLLPTGLRLMHFAAAGLLLAIAVPLLLLSLLVKHDPRARSPLQIERDAGLPVLGTIPLHLTQHQSDQQAKRLKLGMFLFATVPVLYGVIFILKLADVL